MTPTDSPSVNDLFAHLLPAISTVLNTRLVGVYLVGSLVTGGYDDHSDVDLIVVMDSPVDVPTFVALDTLHTGLVAAHPQWDNHLEILYVAQTALSTFREQTSPLGVISPGEPFHVIHAGDEWLANWYALQSVGRVLIGPPPSVLSAPISHTEFLGRIKADALEWPTRVAQPLDRYGQSYAILTICRAWYTLHHRVQVSKLVANQWAAAQRPEWAVLLERAWRWRSGWQGPSADPYATLPDTRRLVESVAAIIRSSF